jgi:hypothetical protein
MSDAFHQVSHLRSAKIAKHKHHMNSQGLSRLRQNAAATGRTAMGIQPIHGKLRSVSVFFMRYGFARSID